MEMSKPVVADCAADVNNQNLNGTATRTSQGEEKEKRKLKRKLNSGDSLGEPKEKMMKCDAQLTDDDDELRCSICKELFAEAVTLTCSHSFCKYCIDYWRRNKTNCPICRARIGSVSPTSVINNLVLKIIDKCSDEVKERRINMIEERTEEAAAYANNGGELLILVIINSNTSSENEEEEEASSSSGSEWSYETVDSDENYEEEDEEYLTTEDGSETLYGGYGCCYFCSRSGHLAHECPNRLYDF